MVEKVCRLCLSTEGLVWIFDPKSTDNMKEIIEVMCGVEISRTDTVTQMVCSTCCQVTIKMYQFRTKSIKNDKDLKARCAGYNIAQLTSTGSNQNSKPDAPVAKATTPATPHITIKPISSNFERYKFAHPSIKEVVKKNPNITLPNSCLKSHVGAYITLLTDEVDEYFKERNMTDAEITKLKAEAYELAVNPKKTSAPNKRKSSSREEKRERLVSPFTGSKRPRLSTDSSDKVSVSSDDVHPSGKENLKNTVNETPKKFMEDARVILNSSIKIRSATPINNAKISQPKLKVDKPAEVPAKRSDCVLETLLTNEPAKKRTSPREEITLKSILRHERAKIGLGLIDNDDDDDILDVEGPPSPAPSPTHSDKEVPRPKSRQTEKSKNSDEKHTKTVSPAGGTRTVTTASGTKAASAISDTKTATVASGTKAATAASGTKAATAASGTKAATAASGTKTATAASGAKAATAASGAKAATAASGTKTVTDENGTKTVPDEDFQLFTSRPFLKDEILKMIMVNGEPVVISDSEDENNDNSDKNDNGNGDTASEAIVLDLDSRSSSNSKYSDSDKTTFTEALRLAPKAPEGSNQPDLSLLALANKTRTLYTCRVCDSQHASLKDLKYHERRTHTKCPFCNKRFRTLANRDEHVSSTCLINRSPVKLKHARLELIRVNEVEEIVKQYATAFEEFNRNDSDKETEGRHKKKMNEATHSAEKTMEGTSPTNEGTHSREATNEERSKEGNPSKLRKNEGSRRERESRREKERAEVMDLGKSVQKPKTKVNDAPMDCDAATADAISELEQFLNYAEVIPVKGKRSSGVSTKTVREPSVRSDDVICISDEESEENQSAPRGKQTSPKGNQETSKESSDKPRDTHNEFQVNLEGGERTINVVNSDVLNDINIHDNDFNVLKAILFKNWKRLKSMKEDKANQIKTSLKDSPIVDGNSSRMKIFKNLRKFLHQYKIPIEVKYSPTVSVQYKSTTPAPPVRLTGLWTNLVPQQLKTYISVASSTTTPATPKTTGYTVLNGQIAVGMKQVFQSVPVTSGPRQTVISNSAPQQLQPQITNVANVQDSNVTTTNLILSSASLPSSSHQASLILNGTPTLTTTTAPFTNYIVVQNAAVLPSTQGPLPVIESVRSAGDTPAAAAAIEQQPPLSAAVAQLESITNSLMPTSQTTDAVVTAADVVNEVVTNAVKEVLTVPNVVNEVPSTSASTNATESAIPQPAVQPAIRVRNLKELS